MRAMRWKSLKESKTGLSNVSFHLETKCTVKFVKPLINEITNTKVEKVENITIKLYIIYSQTNIILNS